MPLNYLRGKIERGELGLEAGKGYYDWRGVDPVAVRREKDEALIKRTKEVLAWRKRQNEKFHIKPLKHTQKEGEE